MIDAGSPATTYYVHADHLNRPIAMTDASKAFVAQYTWLPFGELYSYTGTAGIDLRFPGQMFQHESGLLYNWFRQYDPTIGRYTQPDPLGLLDGLNRFAYVGNDPLQQVDPTGQLAVPGSPTPPASDRVDNSCAEVIWTCVRIGSQASTDDRGLLVYSMLYLCAFDGETLRFVDSTLKPTIIVDPRL